MHLYEEKPVLGGMAGDAIPAFRLTGDSLRRDIDAILKLGVRLHKDTPVDAALFDTLAEENDAVYIAVGAQESLPLGIPGEDAAGVLDQLSFLSAVRRCEPTGIGSHAVVIGAGNSAMDCARAARRLVGENGSVTIAYRRTRKEMPRLTSKKSKPLWTKACASWNCVPLRKSLPMEAVFPACAAAGCGWSPIPTAGVPAPFPRMKPSRWARIRSSCPSGSG